MITYGSGVYLIRNKITQKVYVGASSNIQKRVWSHFTKLRNHSHHSQKLQSAFNIVGEDNFEIEVLEETSDITREQYWCDFYKANQEEFGYNVRKLVHTNEGNKIIVSEETKILLSAIKKGITPSNHAAIVKARRIPINLHINGVFHSSYESQRLASEALNIDYKAINAQIQGRLKNLRGFPNYKFTLKPR